MAIDPIVVAQAIQERFRRYLLTTFDFSQRYPELRDQFRRALEEPNRLFRGPYLHGLAPYVRADSVRTLIDGGVLPRQLAALPLLDRSDRLLYWHQAAAIRRLREGRNIVLATGTGSGKTLAFLIPILAEILENPAPGVHTLLLYPMNALVNDQLKNLRQILKNTPQVRFGRYVNIEVTPEEERNARRLHPEALPHEVISREVFRQKPPHILVTNYAMLEYLLLRADDSPLFQGPWRFVVLDEAHTYTGAKGSEMACLLRRVRCRVKGPNGNPPQFVAPSATLGASDPKRREEVLRFARDLFDASFDAEDLIEARQEHAPAEGTIEPREAIYVNEAVERACEGRQWCDALSESLIESGFNRTAVTAAAKVAARSFDEALYTIFRDDARALRLREASKEPFDLTAAAFHVFGRRDKDAIRHLSGLVRICSLARLPGGDARLVPCRYHFFVRGVNGAYLAFEGADRSETALFLETATATPDGKTRTLQLRCCRKCGQPYLFGYSFTENNVAVLRSLGSQRQGRGEPRWFTWDPPQSRSEDEAEEAPEHGTGAVDATEIAYDPATGAYRPAEAGDYPSGRRLWLINEQDELTRCVGCGGANTVTAIRADADAAQAVVAEAFYRHLPESRNTAAQAYPGRGRKLLAFADSRQSAAYFAPYLENTHHSQKMRWLVYQALRQAEQHSPIVTAEDLVRYMLRVGEDEAYFPDTWEQLPKREACLLTLVTEFCLPFGRRQSLEAMGLVACRVNINRKWEPLAELAQYLNQQEQVDLIQVLLSTVRLQKAIVLPPPLVSARKEFRFQQGEDAFIDQGSEQYAGRIRLHGFVPQRASHLQRRSAYLDRVLKVSAKRSGGSPPSDEEVRRLLYAIWRSLVEASRPVFKRRQVAAGQSGFQLQWEELCFNTGTEWYVCPDCQQWSAFHVCGVCPSFRCSGQLERADPGERLSHNHYRRVYCLPTEKPVPLTAREHTAQLSPRLATDYQLAFQEGHHQDYGQINVLSSSTTFELGVDLGDLEAVFLRNIPPSSASYQQRAGRAGRGIGSAAFVVTFTMPRSHDEHFFATPEDMIGGIIRPPRIHLRNDIIIRRHVQAVLLAEFVRGQKALGCDLRTIGQFVATDLERVTCRLDEFLAGTPDAIDANAAVLSVLVPPDFLPRYQHDLKQKLPADIVGARDYYAAEIEMYDEALRDALRRRNELERERKHEEARRIGNLVAFLQRRIESLENQDWISFFSDRGVLPSYAFPIHSVTLATPDPNLKLDRDLRLALSEYVPGAEVVANGRLWRSIGIRLPPRRRALDRKCYAHCPQCWHVMRHLDGSQVFPGRNCPVCGHDGRQPRRTKHVYLVPSYGFTTDLQNQGDELSFDRPLRIPASRVLFVPQQTQDDPVVVSLPGTGGLGLEVRATENADFFVFNDGDDPTRRGFSLCRSCGKLVDRDEHGQTPEHDTPLGKTCRGQAEWLHLGHDFRSCAARLIFKGTGMPYSDHGFWQTLLYALLGGMSDAMEIEANDINGVIRPINLGGQITQEIVLFDDVPGGAGHVQRLQDQDELQAVLAAAYARVAHCTNCDPSASCYRCLRSYRNQFCHDLLVRKPVAEYLERLLADVARDPDDDHPYELPDKASAIQSALRQCAQALLVADQLTTAGPQETGPWYILLQDCAARQKEIRVALRDESPVEAEGLSAVLPLLALQQAGAQIFRVHPGAPPPPYGLLVAFADGRYAAFHWGETKTTLLDSETHVRKLWYNRSARRLAVAHRQMEQWFEQHAVLIEIQDVVPKGYVVHAVRKHQPVDFARIFRSASGQPIREVVLQDPYLATRHQLDCLRDFLGAIQWPSTGVPIPFKLVSQRSEPFTRDPRAIPAAQQERELQAVLTVFPALSPQIELRSRQGGPLHMRYVVFFLEGDRKLLYALERGLDLKEPGTAHSRANSYVLEFPDLPSDLQLVLGL